MDQPRRVERGHQHPVEAAIGGVEAAYERDHHPAGQPAQHRRPDDHPARTFPCLLKPGPVGNRQTPEALVGVRTVDESPIAIESADPTLDRRPVGCVERLPVAGQCDAAAGRLVHALQQFQRAFGPFEIARDMRLENACHVGRFITTGGEAAITRSLNFVNHVADAYCRGERPQKQVWPQQAQAPGIGEWSHAGHRTWPWSGHAARRGGAL